jgi:hypothetical protein
MKIDGGGHPKLEREIRERKMGRVSGCGGTIK